MEDEEVLGLVEEEVVAVARGEGLVELCWSVSFGPLEGIRVPEPEAVLVLFDRLAVTVAATVYY